MGEAAAVLARAEDVLAILRAHEAELRAAGIRHLARCARGTARSADPARAQRPSRNYTPHRPGPC